jgi:hypothetical protein
MKTVDEIKQEISAGIKTPKGKNTTSASKVVEAIQKTIIDTVVGDGIESIVEAIKPELTRKLIEIYGVLPQIHEIKTPTVTRRVEGVTHEKFDEILNMVNLGIPVFMTGKSGTGKNIICKQVADALGLEFYFTNAVTQEYRLTGFIDAHGNYQKTQFYDAFTKGGVFFLDEMDASVPEVLVILNAAIANGYFDFPTGRVEAHENFRVIAAGNTVGKGADNNYTGRYCIDAASLDRFALVEIDYSQKIEENICENNTELINFVHKFRETTEKCGIECLCSYRTMQRITMLEKTDMSLCDIMNVSLFKGMPIDDRNIILEQIIDLGLPKDNKYYKASKGPNFTL